MKTPSTEDLLISLGWPSGHENIGAKGRVTWQRKHPGSESELTPPVTLSLVVSPDYIRIKALNIAVSENIQPHFEAEWSISENKDYPVFKHAKLAGQPIAESANQAEKAIEVFSGLKSLINATPYFLFMGSRIQPKDQTPSAKK